MRAKLIEGAPRKWVLVIATGEDPVDELTRFARAEQVPGAHFTAIGAFSQALLGYFDWDAKAYRDIPIREQVEVLSLTGDIAESTEGPKVHAHAVLGRADGSACGGHLRSARVRPTLEVVVTETSRHLVRVHDMETGLALIDLSRSGPASEPSGASRDSTAERGCAGAPARPRAARLSAATLAIAAVLLAAAGREPARAGTPHASAAHPAASPDETFASSMNDAIARMHAGMAIAQTGDPDRDFARMMIPHHQGAVDMALVELRFGKNERLRRLAQGIIVEQRQEIAVMRSILDERERKPAASP